MKNLIAILVGLGTFIGIILLVNLGIHLVSSEIQDPTWHGVALVVMWLVFGFITIVISVLVAAFAARVVLEVLEFRGNNKRRKVRQKNGKP